MRASGMARLFAKVLPGRLAGSLLMLDATRPAIAREPYATPTAGQRGSFTLLQGCVMQGLFADTNRATVRTLRMNGYSDVASVGQGCCGALHAHAGDAEGARRLARKNIDAFEQSGADFVVSNAAGCGAMLHEYGQLLADDPDYAARAARISERARDVTELLAAAGPTPGGELKLHVTYDAPCHLLHAQRISAPPLKVLAAIPGLQLVPLVDADYCCGAAGIYNLLEPETSAKVLAPKLEHIERTGATLVATGNPGCHMQIGAGLIGSGMQARTVHPVDLLDASYAAAKTARKSRPQ
jgi:glycolate oxidase iron-sulfur subunit